MMRSVLSLCLWTCICLLFLSWSYSFPVLRSSHHAVEEKFTRNLCSIVLHFMIQKEESLYLSQVHTSIPKARLQLVRLVSHAYLFDQSVWERPKGAIIGKIQVMCSALWPRGKRVAVNENSTKSLEINKGQSKEGRGREKLTKKIKMGVPTATQSMFWNKTLWLARSREDAKIGCQAV